MVEELLLFIYGLMPRTEPDLPNHDDRDNYTIDALAELQRRTVEDIQLSEDRRAIEMLSGADMAHGQDTTAVTLFGRPASPEQVNRYQELHDRMEQVSQSLARSMSSFVGRHATPDVLTQAQALLQQEMDSLRNDLMMNGDWRQQYVLGTFEPERDHFGPSPLERGELHNALDQVRTAQAQQRANTEFFQSQGLAVDSLPKTPHVEATPAKLPVTLPDFRPGRTLDLPEE